MLTQSRREPTVERDAVQVLCAGDLRGHLHAAGDERFAKHVLHGRGKELLVGQLADHGDGVLFKAR